jgi:hypothetical protein
MTYLDRDLRRITFFTQTATETQARLGDQLKLKTLAISDGRSGAFPALGGRIPNTDETIVIFYNDNTKDSGYCSIGTVYGVLQADDPDRFDAKARTILESGARIPYDGVADRIIKYVRDAQQFAREIPQH